MNEPLDLATLRVIVAAAELGSISAAGDRLQLAVAAASARITALEEALGLRVFERSSRGVRLTPAGQMLVRRGREILVDMDRLSVDLHDYAKGLQGHVRLAANTSAMLEVLPAKLDRMAREHPLIRIDVVEHGSLDIPLLLLEGRADLGIVDMAHAPHGISLTDCFSDTLVLVVPAGHALAGAAPLALEQALDEQFIALHDGTALSNRLMRSASQAGKALKIRMQMRSFDAVCRMVAGGLGVAVLPLQAIGPQLASLPLAAVPLTDAWAARTHRIALRSGVEPSPATLTLIDFLLR
ncbi:LysR substrate-binding domain-containing protein [Variovorax guangxiensis]|uniref:LysR substrate-binding domain-containing protein n=1 Tax=Variovorax guangxiensis TaxID=1775474 RepID=UPI00285A9849|nr:LysR substrate-binding domain-containing protein [Variovorax guangxiensis]MDR6857082.1 DNA-binding transcriptional LysR family regulator [Variovorax guangxiensis]